VPTVRLADVTTKIGSGITPRGGSTVYKAAGRPFIRSQNVGWGDLRLDEMAYIDEATHSTFPATEIRTGDVLLNITGASIGRSAVATPELDGGNVNQHVCEIRLKPGRMDPRYVNAFLLSNPGQGQIDMFQAGGNRQGLNFQQVGSIQVPDLAIEQQRAIGAASQSADDVIATLERLIDKKQAIKQGVMQQLLTGRTRVPGFDSLWRLVRMRELVDGLQAGVSVRSDTQGNSRVSILKTSSIDRGRFVPSEAKPILGDEVSRARCNPIAGSMIVSRMNTPQLVGEVGFVAETRLDLFLPDRLWLARRNPRTKTDMRWLTYYFASDAGSRSMRELATGTSGSMKNIPKARLLDLMILVPPEDEQVAIATVLGDMDREIDGVRQRLQKSNVIKTGMMQQLLTGRTRLAVEAAS
jgi:type I restriction enzyme, S subunit